MVIVRSAAEIKNDLKTFRVLIKAKETLVHFTAVPLIKVAFFQRMPLLTVSPEQMYNFTRNVPGITRDSEHVV